MAVKNLLALLKQGVQIQSLEDIVKDVQGPRLVVDVASWIFPATKLVAGSDEIVTDVPNASPSLLTISISRKLNPLLKVPDARAILVFDGRRFPPKQTTNLQREWNLKQAADDLEQFRKRTNMNELGLQPEDEKEYSNKKKAASCPREDLVHDIINWAKRLKSVAVLAPFEADAQVVYLE